MKSRDRNRIRDEAIGRINKIYSGYKINMIGPLKSQGIILHITNMRAKNAFFRLVVTFHILVGRNVK